MKRAAVLTVIAYLTLLVSLGSSVCPPAAHVPIIFGVIGCLLLVAAMFLTLLKWSASSKGKRLAVGLLVGLQVLPVAFVIWAMSRTQAGAL